MVRNPKTHQGEVLGWRFEDRGGREAQGGRHHLQVCGVGGVLQRQPLMKTGIGG